MNTIHWTGYIIHRILTLELIERHEQDRIHRILTLELIERHEQDRMHRITGTEKVSRNKSLVAETSNLKIKIL